MRRRGRALPVKSIFIPKNPEKYHGTKTRKPGGEFGVIVARSGWEQQVMKFLDEEPNVIAWSSEFPIPFLHPLDKRVHQYFADFLIQARQLDGTTKTIIVEIKPAKQAKQPPKNFKDKLTRAINEAKWTAAAAYCKTRGIQFKILTEEEIAFAR